MQFVPTNLRLVMLVAAIVLGVAVQKQAHHGEHADCGDCIKASAVL